MDKKLHVYGIRPMLELLESNKEIEVASFLHADLNITNILLNDSLENNTLHFNNFYESYCIIELNYNQYYHFILKRHNNIVKL